MRIHPSVTHINGVVTVSLQAQFQGDSTDTLDQQKIQSYGDPQVNLGGTFSDPNDSTFIFATGSSSVQVGLLQQMQLNPAQFMTSLPPSLPGKPMVSQGPLVVVTPDPVRAAAVWEGLVVARIGEVMSRLRTQQPPLSSLPDSTV